MTIIDSQVHVYEANTPKRPWHSVPNWPAHVTGNEMVAAMDKVGVDGAIFISAFSIPLQRQLCGGSAAGPSRPVRDRQAGRPGGSGGAHYCPPMTISRPGTGSSNPSPSSSESNANLTLPCRAGTRGDLRLGHKLLGPAVKWARC